PRRSGGSRREVPSLNLRSRAFPLLLAIAGPAFLAAGAMADPAVKPAAKTAAAADKLPSPKEADAAAASLNAFASQSLAKMQRVEDENRRKPTRASVAGEVTYTGYTDEFRVETRPTGYAGAPFVGLIRYSEQIFSCADPGATRCGVKQTTPITEIFRFQD